MKKLIKAGATSQTLDLFIQDKTQTDGRGLTGLAFNTATITAYYRKGATGTATAITLATQTVGGAFSSGGFVEIDATNMPGMYRFDIPNAAIDTAGSVSLLFKAGGNMAALPIELQIITPDLEAALATPTNITSATGVDITKILGTAISTPATAGILDINVKNMNNVAATPITTIKAVQGLAVDGVITTLTNLPAITANWLTAAGTAADFGAELAAAIWDEDATAHQTAGTFGKAIGDPLAATNSLIQRTPDAVAGATNGLFIAGTNAATTVTTALTTTFTGNLSGSVGSVGAGGIAAASFAAGAIDAAAIANAAIDNATFAADVGSTAIATNVIGIASQKGTVAALNVDTYAEPGQETPAATNTLVKKIGYLFKAWRNRTTQTATAYNLFNDDALTVDQKATVSDDATTFDKTEIATGP